jgi:hypothetical protein
MSNLNQPQEQQHPQEKIDRELINRLLRENSTDFNLCELARLRIRYRNFPGARQIQRDLDLLLTQWQLNEEQLFEKTRQIHAKGKVYQRRGNEEQQDWS